MRLFSLIRTWVLCLLLAGAAAFFGYRTHLVWSAADHGAVATAVPAPPARAADRRVAYRRSPPRKTYAVIARKNLFSPARREEVSTSVPKPPPARPPRPSRPLDRRFSLFGIVSGDADRKALVSNLDPKTGATERYIWVRVGEKTGNLTISEIGPGHVVVTDGNGVHTVLLAGARNRPPRPAGQRGGKQDEVQTIHIRRAEAKPEPRALGNRDSQDGSNQ